MPPAWKIESVNQSALPGSWPRTMFSHDESAPPAIRRPGIAGASAWKITLGRKCPITWREPTAAGGVQFRIDPSGAVTRTGRNEPSLCGTSGASAALIANEP